MCSSLPWFVRSFEAWLATTEAVQDQEDIEGAALVPGIAAFRARVEACFDAGTNLELLGTRGTTSSMM